ncbi:helix-turn-helix domain-containing protein [Paenibacillus sp. ACRRY]|uniref:helix-turn-helix domain-containing protein n=1 Tax=Paenibacillus sp. ACRRY TaxID=2918208 RepID=UPI001EF656A3|nr:helix-turn-helix domain-containing protein [Paenibacillus sp. ACRRY]MCG7386044.1 AraC family transcriptional regulator [Paenibacillus sp. ACRRY]
MDTDVIFPNMTSTLQVTGCHFGRKSPGWVYPKHHHHLYEVLYCQCGEGRLQIGADEILLGPGDWLFIRAGARHQMENAHTHDSEMRRTLSQREYRLIPHSKAATTELPAYVAKIEREMQYSLSSTSLSVPNGPETRITLTSVQKMALQAYILLIIQELILLQSGEVEASPDVIPEATMHKADTAHRIEEQLQNIISSEGSITQMAEELNLSRSQCTKIFKEIYGISPRQYVTEKKLNHAKQLLVSTNKTIEDIADELGYHSVSHFSRQFRRGTGLSPNQFRPRPMT